LRGLLKGLSGRRPRSHGTATHRTDLSLLAAKPRTKTYRLVIHSEQVCMAGVVCGHLGGASSQRPEGQPTCFPNPYLFRDHPLPSSLAPTPHAGRTMRFLGGGSTLSGQLRLV